MWAWISDNSDALNVIVSALMLLVWGVYLQLLLNNYRRNRRTKILINRANGHSLDTQCVVTNMSAEAIYVEGVIAELRGEDDETPVACSLTDVGGRVEPGRSNGEDGYQGPLDSGASVEVGTYRQIVERALSLGETGLRRVTGLTLTLVATYGSENQPAAAQRAFEIVDHAGEQYLRSEMMTTRQVRSRGERRALEAQMQREAGTRALETMKRHRVSNP